MEWTVYSTSVEMTERIGEALGEQAQTGDVITLDGDLGAGKTAMTRGIARGMGLPCRVTSPTFTIVNEYNDAQGNARLFHFDTYRLSNSDDFYDAGLDEYFGRDGICVIEWSQVIEDALPSDRIRLLISGNGDTRTIRISFSDDRKEKMEELRKKLQKEGIDFEDTGM